MNRAFLMLILALLACNPSANAEEVPADKPELVKPQPLAIKFQAHARYVAGGQPNERRGGWGPSDNFPRPIGKGDTFGEPDALSVVVTPGESVRLGKYEGLRIRVVNRSKDTESFAAIDSHLYLMQEAMNEKGEWQAIERTPHGTGPRDCGVGFHRISLNPGEYWELAGPRYSGPFKTKLRYRLDLGTKVRDIPQPGGKVIYSSEFDGSINTGQLQRGPTSPFDLKPL